MSCGAARQLRRMADGVDLDDSVVADAVASVSTSIPRVEAVTTHSFVGPTLAVVPVVITAVGVVDAVAPGWMGVRESEDGGYG